ncbi:type I-E CRISPR-associated protein Cse1/CasA [Streptomyces sp. NPDC048577]|uniref:type I-E CRISPR-associated protein Cse1/CasA n=1 Tax=Streptomyces sp. NPDC048577 TaxID=3157209 RepID=UPI003441F246
MRASTHNLFEEPLVPVRWTPGAAGPCPERVGLRELLLRSSDISAVAVSDPPAHAAILRILYALTARVTGLDVAGSGDWAERRLDILDAGQLPVDGIDAYVSRTWHRFFVFDPEGGRPWMQDARLAEQCDSDKSAGVNKLIVTRPAGNTHAWFRHGSDARPDRPTVADAVLNLLVWHYYGPSGRCSAREVNGVKTASASAGPLRTALSYHPEGANLLETLLAGLVEPPRAVRREDDLCPWEWDELPDPEALPSAPAGPCARLTACSQHALLFVPDADDPGRVADAFITWAYRSGRIPRDDDYLIWQISQQGNRYPRPADSRRALWRDLDALLLQEPTGTTQPKRPRVFEYAGEVSDYLRVRALGFEQEGQAKDIQFVDATTPPVLGFTEKRAEEEGHATAPAIGRLRQLGELYGRRLDRAIRRAWTQYTDDAKADADTWAFEAAARYWPGAELEFWDRFRQLGSPAGSEEADFDAGAARTAFLGLALAAYTSVTASVTRTQRGAKAVSQARIELFGGTRKKSKAPTAP